MNWKPQDSPLWHARLTWMIENEPELVDSLFRNQQLKTFLDFETAGALRVISALKERGLTEDEAREQVVANLVAPSNGRSMREPEPPKLPAETLRRISQWKLKLAELPPQDVDVDFLASQKLS